MKDTTKHPDSLWSAGSSVNTTQVDSTTFVRRIAAAIVSVLMDDDNEHTLEGLEPVLERFFWIADCVPEQFVTVILTRSLFVHGDLDPITVRERRCIPFTKIAENTYYWIAGGWGVEIEGVE